MQLTVRDVCKLFRVGEATVDAWIKKQRMPAQEFAGQRRFNSMELLEWAAAQRVKVAPELLEQFKTRTDNAPSLADALEAGGIRRLPEARDKDGVLAALSEALPLAEQRERQRLLELFQAREASGSTAIGGGIALPHVRNPIVLHVAQPLITLGFLERPVEFGAADGVPVSILFAMICPTVRSHLQMLMRLSFALQDPAFHAVITRQARRDEVLREARRIDAALNSTERAKAAS